MHELGERLRDALKAVRLLKQQAPPSAVPTGMVGILATIATIAPPAGGHPGCHVKDLAVHNALDPSTVSRAVAALIRLGLVRRTADPADGRASFLALTPAGVQALDETHRWYGDRLADALHDWSPAEVAAFAAMLHRFATDVIDHHTDLEAAR